MLCIMPFYLNKLYLPKYCVIINNTYFSIVSIYKSPVLNVVKLKALAIKRYTTVKLSEYLC